MAIISGKLGYIGIGLQPNATPVTPAKYIAVTGGNFDTQPVHTYPKEFRKQMESTGKPIRSGQESTGTMKASAYPGGGGLETLMKAAFGTVASTPLGTLTRKHTFTPNQTDIPAYSIVVGLSETTPDRYPWAKIKTLKINLAKDAPVEIETEWLSKGISRTLDPFTPSYSTPPALTYLDAAVNFDGVASTLVESMNITIDRATEATKTMNGSRDPTYILPTDFKTTGTMQLLFDGDSEYKRFLGNPTTATSMQDEATPVKLELILTGAFIETSFYQKMTMSLEEVYYDRLSFDPLQDGTVKIGFDWTAAKPQNSTPSNRVEIESTQASPFDQWVLAQT